MIDNGEKSTPTTIKNIIKITGKNTVACKWIKTTALRIKTFAIPIFSIILS
ncbi:MAG: hypothetical protein HY769_02985 [Candidatus Stahlbacteria bacterium]|nr:hypothetical protein [Candidatus Stahlbacteria bacterium]